MKQETDYSVLTQLQTIAEGLSQTFAPFCEIVVHDLTKPDQAIAAIYNNLSGRQVGQPATELGLQRIDSTEFPAILANYANQFSDGRPVKSTSIGIKNPQGQYVAALCLNIDLTLFQAMQHSLQQFTQTASPVVNEHLEPIGSEAIRQRINQFAASAATTPRALKPEQRRLLLQELKESGLLEIKKAMETVAQHLGISRASVYLYAKDSE